MRQPRMRAIARSGAVSSSSASEAYSAMRQPGRRRSQPSALRATRCALEVRSLLSRARRRARSAARKDLRAAAKVGSGSVTRRCRCEPLLSNQSNKWDELQQVRLSARSGLAQFCPQVLMSRGVSIRVRGNPARLSNTAGDAGRHSTGFASGRESRIASQLELLALLERALDPLTQDPQAVAHLSLELRVLVLDAQQLMGEIERNHDGDAVVSYELAAIPDLAHAAVEKLGRIQQGRALLVRACDDIFLFHDAHADLRAVLWTHAPCSSVLRRPIIASTRVRTCSFLCMSVARSVARDSCR